eukprot:3362927-Lingulodinium_polyedra.AAC.1
MTRAERFDGAVAQSNLKVFRSLDGRPGQQRYRRLSVDLAKMEACFADNAAARASSATGPAGATLSTLSTIC